MTAKAVDHPAFGGKEIRRRAAEAGRRLRRCSLCPRECGADRTAGETGFCGSQLLPRVAALSVHHGEEPPISGNRGSGNVFFTGCNLACLYCQNYPISRLGTGKNLSEEALADAMIVLQEKGAHNINFVSPTPWVPQILAALALAVDKGLSIPLVYNTGGYEKPEVLALLEGVIDIYLPDMKYPSNSLGWRYSRVPRYAAVNVSAVEEMVRQVGPLLLNGDTAASRGVLIRHLVLPEGQSGSRSVLATAAALSPGIPISLMFQYFPAWRAARHPLIGRRLWRDECTAAMGFLDDAGITSGWHQEYG